MKTAIITFLVALTFSSMAQTNIKFGINHTVNGEAFSALSVGTNSEGDEFSIHRGDYFISGISIAHDGGDDIVLSDTYLFVDALRSKAFDLGELEVGEIKSISFYLGIDSANNHADPTLWPKDHALAPRIPDMHWGWAAGYRFVALEGKAGEGRAIGFQAHSVGDQFYFPVTVPVKTLEVDGSTVISLNAELTEAIYGLDVSQGFISHGSDGEAVVVMENFRDRVFTSADGFLSTSEVAKILKMEMYPNPSTERLVHVSIPESSSRNFRLEVTNVLGASIHNQAVVDGTVSLSFDQGGTFMVFVYENDQVVAQELLMVH